MPRFKGYYSNYYTNHGLQILCLGCCCRCVRALQCTASFPHLLLLAIEGVGADPGVGDGEPWGQVEGGQEGRQGALQQVRVPTHGVLRLAHVRALGEEADVAGWEESREQKEKREKGLGSTGGGKVVWAEPFPTLGW